MCFIGGKLEPSAADLFPGCDSCLLTQHVNVTYFPKYVLILWYSAPEAMGGGLPHAAAAAAAQPHVDHFILLETPPASVTTVALRGPPDVTSQPQ